MHVRQAEINVMVLEQVLQPFLCQSQRSTSRQLDPASIARPTLAVGSVLRMQALQGLLQGCMGVVAARRGLL
jgi:hypothetical protein